VFFSLSVCLLGFPVQCAFPCSFSLFRYLPLSFCLRFSAPVPSGFGSCSAPCFFLFQSPVLSAFPSFSVSIVLPFSCRFLPCIFAFFLCFMPCCFPLVFGPLLSGFSSGFFSSCLNSRTKPKLGLALCFLSFVHSAGSFSPWFLLPPLL
jgi:hypothetical protein